MFVGKHLHNVSAQTSLLYNYTKLNIMNNSGEAIGKLGEDLACQFLSKKNYKILERNYRRPWGEIDIVCRAPDATLVFVEVKTMKIRDTESLSPEDNMSSHKIAKFRRAAEAFAHANEGLVNLTSGWRIDLIAVDMPELLTNTTKNVTIRHYKNI